MNNVKKDVSSNSHVNDVFKDILNGFISNGGINGLSRRLANKEVYDKRIERDEKDEKKVNEIIANNVDEL